MSSNRQSSSSKKSSQTRGAKSSKSDRSSVNEDKKRTSTSSHKGQGSKKPEKGKAAAGDSPTLGHAQPIFDKRRTGSGEISPLSLSTGAQGPDKGPGSEYGSEQAIVSSDSLYVTSRVNLQRTKEQERHSTLARLERPATPGVRFQLEEPSKLSAPAPSADQDIVSWYMSRATSGRTSPDWETSSGIELRVPGLNTRMSDPPIGSPYVAPFIRRKNSCTLDLDDYREGLWVKDPAAEDAWFNRTEMLRDWIDHHGFEENLAEAYGLVRWDKVHFIERRLVFCHAMRRATVALKENVMLREQTPWGARHHKKVTLSYFVRPEDNPGKQVLVYDIDKLPDLADELLGIHDLTPGTIVLLAKISHRIMERNDELATEVEQWNILVAWLTGSPEMTASTPERDWRLLKKYFISDRVLEEGAYFIPVNINKAIASHNAERLEMHKQSGGRILPRVLRRADDVETGPLPPRCVDICTALSIGKARYSISDMPSYPKEYTGSSADKQAKDRAREEFTRSLAYRASTFNQIRANVKGDWKKVHDLLAKDARKLKKQAKAQKKAEGKEVDDDENSSEE